MLDDRIRTDHIVTCDNCERRLHMWPNDGLDRKVANDLGWQCSADRDLCPSCKSVEVS